MPSCSPIRTHALGRLAESLRASNVNLIAPEAPPGTSVVLPSMILRGLMVSIKPGTRQSQAVQVQTRMSEQVQTSDKRGRTHAEGDVWIDHVHRTPLPTRPSATTAAAATDLRAGPDRKSCRGAKRMLAPPTTLAQGCGWARVEELEAPRPESLQRGRRTPTRHGQSTRPSTKCGQAMDHGPYAPTLGDHFVGKRETNIASLAKRPVRTVASPLSRRRW